jgi:hypothetical protein
LVATLVVSAAGAASAIRQNQLLARAATVGITDAEAAANDSRQLLIGILQAVFLLGTAVVFLMWFRRVHKNLPALGGRDLKYSPGWAVGGFFVPFLNLVRPLQVMREIWHGSDPSRLERDLALGGASIRNQLGTPSLVRWWWGLFLAFNFLGGNSTRMASAPNPTLHELQVSSSLLVLSDALAVPGTLLAILLVTRMTRWQGERRERIRQRIGQLPTVAADELSWGSDETVA